MESYTLSPQLLDQLVNIMAEEGQFDWMAKEMCVVIPSSRVPSPAGKIPIVPAAMMMGSSEEDGQIGFTDPTTESTFELSERDYDTQRIGFNIPLSEKLIKNVDLYEEAENSLVPALANKIQFEVDHNILGEILKGNGLEADSKDVTVYSVDTNGNGWDHEDGEPLDEFETHLKLIGGSANVRLVLSTDRAQVLQKSPQVTEAYHGQGNGRLGRSQLAEYLEDYLSIDDVQIGRNIYQDGAVTDTFDAEFQWSEVAFLTKKPNLVLVPFGGENPDVRQEYLEDENVTKTISDVHLDICTYDPAHSVAFTDVTDGESA